MTVYKNKSECSGCGVCSEVCPQKCITMREDSEGFLFPVVEEERCINCKACKKSCHYNKSFSKNSEEPLVYAGQYDDSDLLLKVSSGGVSLALMEEIVKRKGVVYGAVTRKVGDVVHKRIDNVNDLMDTCGSKYLYSSLQDILSLIKRDINDGRVVLFTGTPCQVAAIKSHLGENDDKLYTCEVICHGIPSSKVYRKYIDELQKNKGKKVISVKNRNKDAGWDKNQYQITFDDGEVVKEDSTKNIFHAGYLSGLFNRKSCSECRYSTLPRIADVTLGDYWMYEGELKLSNKNRGISLVVVNSEKGENLLKLAEDRLLIDKSNLAYAKKSCRHLWKKPETNANRENFFKSIDFKTYKELFDEFGPKNEKIPFKYKMINKYKEMFNKNKEFDTDTITAYLRDIGVNPSFPNSLLDLIHIYRTKNGKVAIIDNGLYVRVCRLLKIEYMWMQLVAKRADMYFPFKDAVHRLTQRGVAVYFINRIGKIKSDEYYTPLANERMNNHLSFIKMAEEKGDYSEHFKELLGEKYSEEYIEELEKIPQIISLGSKYIHEDSYNKLVNVIGGIRKTEFQPETFDSCIHFYGRCGAFGYAVEDSETVPSQLQLLLNKDNKKYKVVNHGLWGADDKEIDNNFLIDAQSYKKDDIVLFYRYHFDKKEIVKLETEGLIYKEINDEFYEFEESKWCFYDEVGHLNRDGYRIVASLIYSFLNEKKFERGRVQDASISSNQWEKYVLHAKNSDFDRELERYISDVINKHPIISDEKKCGAIVMNCNPFTKGHRYLVEYASKQVDRLYIFVVEENKSFFKYEDRFEMVKNGVSDLKNVVVVSSGKFIISALTFPEYFMKDYVQKKDFNVSNDVTIFCDYIAPKLNITVRFVGEEPSDVVTNHYNEVMQKILPSKGIEFVEIPRLKRNEEEYISATKVREFIKNGNVAELEDFIPKTTFDILMKQGYINNCNN